MVFRLVHLGLFLVSLLSLPTFVSAAEDCPKRFGRIAKTSMQDVQAVLEKETEQSAATCGKNISCIQEKLREKFPKKFWADTCLAKNPAAVSGLFYNLAVSSAMIASTYAAAHPGMSSLEDQKDFPVYFLLNTVAWAPVFSEVACRNQVSTDETDSNQALGLHGRLRNFGNASKRYMTWIAGATTTGLVADELDKARKEGDTYRVPSPEELGKLLGTYLVFNVGVATARNVLILDPLYLKAFPWMKDVIAGLVKQKVIAKVIVVPVEFTARTLIGAANRAQFVAYRDWVRREMEKK